MAVIEVVSPGNKGSRSAVRSFADMAVEFLSAGIHLLVVDLFPPTRRDPDGLNNAIGDEIGLEPFDLLARQPLSLAGYDAGPPETAYIETIGFGDPTPAMPVFLAPSRHALLPLEPTYAATWAATPEPVREQVAPARRRRRI